MMRESNQHKKKAIHLLTASRQGNLKQVQHCVELQGTDPDSCDESGHSALWMASKHGHVDIVRYLLQEQYADGDVSNSWGMRPLHAASRAGHVDVVRELIQDDAEVNAFDGKGNTPLHEACSWGHAQVAECLLEFGAEVDGPNDKGETALCHACQRSNSSVVKLLLSEPWQANVKYACNEAWSPLHYACHNIGPDCTDIAQRLVHAGADINAESLRGETPLFLASQANHVALVELLLSLGADANMKTHNDRSPLLVACLGQNTAIISLLIRRGKADAGSLLLHASSKGLTTIVQVLIQHGHVKSVDEPVRERKSGGTGGANALYLACKRGHEAVVHALLSARASIRASRHPTGGTPLHAASHKGYTRIVQLLLQHAHEQGYAKQLNANIDNEGQVTALWLACQGGHLAVVKQLLESSASRKDLLDRPDILGVTPLWIACKRGHLDVVELVLKQGANPNAATFQDEMTPLHSACQKGLADVVQVLLDHDTAQKNNEDLNKSCGHRLDVNAVTRGTGSTALHVACCGRANNLRIVQMLLQAGAKANLQMKSVGTPLVVAASSGHADIVQLLLEHELATAPRFFLR